MDLPRVALTFLRPLPNPLRGPLRPLHPARRQQERRLFPPHGEPALLAPDTISWQVFRNPLPPFHAIIFAIHDLGFQARHALIDNTAALRARRIYEELEGSLYSIHELG